MNTPVTALPNSQAEIQKRIANGKITWAGPLIMLSSRTVIGLIVMALVVAIFFRGSVDPWAEAFLWFRMYGVLVGLCLIPLFYLARREGISILDIGNYSRKGWLRDVLIGVGLVVPFILLGMGVVVVIMTLLQYAYPAPTEQLPMWATLFTIIIWPIIWAFSEDNTYIGYSLPRVEALTGGRKWLVVVIMWFFLSLQHSLFPFAGLAWQRVVSWSIALIPFTVFYCWLYWRLGRLLPIIVAHLLTDAVSLLISLYLWGY